MFSVLLCFYNAIPVKSYNKNMPGGEKKWDEFCLAPASWRQRQ